MKERLLGRDSVVLEVWYYDCAYVVYFVRVTYMTFCACGVVYI